MVNVGRGAVLNTLWNAVLHWCDVMERRTDIRLIIEQTLRVKEHVAELKRPGFAVSGMSSDPQCNSLHRGAVHST